MRSENCEEPQCLSVQEDSRSLRSVELPETFCNPFPYVPHVHVEDQLNAHPAEGCLLKANEKWTVKTITLIRRAVIRPENNNTDHMFEIKSTRSEGTSSSMQEDCESGCTFELPESLSKAFPNETSDSADAANEAPKGGRPFKASRKGPVRKRASFRNPVQMLETNNLNHHLEVESGIANEPCSLQEDGESRCHTLMPENVRGTLPGVPPFSVETIDMRTREGRLLKANIKAQVKKVTVVKRSQNRPEKNILGYTLAMKHDPAADASSQQEHLESCSTELPESLCDDTFLDAPPVGPEKSKSDPEEGVSSFNNEKEDVRKIALVKKSRKRPWKNNLESIIEVQSGVGEGASSAQEPCGNVELPESLCDTLTNVPLNATEHLAISMEEAHFQKGDAKGTVKKEMVIKNVRKRAAKNNLDRLVEIKKGGDRTSLVQENTAFQCLAERTESACRTLPNAPTGASDPLHTIVEEDIMLSVGTKAPAKDVTFVKPRKRQGKNFDHRLEMISGADAESPLMQDNTKPQCSVEDAESLCSTFPEITAGAADHLCISAEDDLLFNSVSKGAVRKMTLVKKAKNKLEKNNSEHLLEIKSRLANDASLSAREEFKSDCSVEPLENLFSADVPARATENLYINPEEGNLLKINQKGETKNITVKNVRKRTAKNPSEHVLEMKSGTVAGASLLHGDLRSLPNAEPPKSLCSMPEGLHTFSDLPAKESEDKHTNSEAHLIKTGGAVKKMAVVKKAQRPEKHPDHMLEFKSGAGENATLVQEDSNPLSKDELTDCPVSALSGGSTRVALCLNINTEEGNSLKVGKKGLSKQITFVKQARKRPFKNNSGQVIEIESGIGEDTPSVMEDLESLGNAELPESLYSAFSNVPAEAADHLQPKEDETHLFKADTKRAVKKMTLTQKPRTGLEKDSDRVLQMKSERVDDSSYSAHNDTVYRYSVELPESLCSDVPAVPQHPSEAMDISTDGGRLCLFTSSKKVPVKRRDPVKKAKIVSEEILSDHAHEIELGDDASNSVPVDSESLGPLEMSENVCSNLPVILRDALSHVNTSTEDAFLKASQEGQNMSLIQEAAPGVENEPDHLFEMKCRGGDDALVSVQEDSQSGSSFEFPEVLCTDFPNVSPHGIDAADMGTEEGSLLKPTAREAMKNIPFSKKASTGPEETDLDHALEIKSGMGEDPGSFLQEDSESHFSVEGPGSPDVLPHTAEEVDMSMEVDLLGLFQQSKKVRKRPPVKKQITDPGDNTSEPSVKKRGRKKKLEEMEILPNGEVRVKKKPRLRAKDREGGAKPRRRGRRSESGLSNDGAFALDGETILDFGEIFDTVLAEASKWERMKDPEGLARLGFGEGITGTGRLKAPPLSDNDLYSSADEAEDAFFGYSQSYEHKFPSLKRRDFVQRTQVEKRKTSQYFSKKFTEGEHHPRDDLMGAGEDTLSGYEDASDEYLEPVLTDTDGESEDLDLRLPSVPVINGAGPSGLNDTAPSDNLFQGLEVDCKTVEGAILKTEQKQLSVVKNINEQLRRMERHLANLVKVNRLYIRHSLGLTGELVRENASQSLSLQRIAETLESAIPFPTAAGVRLTADAGPSSLSSSVSSDSSDEEWAKRPAKAPKRAKRNREEVAGKRGKKK